MLYQSNSFVHSMLEITVPYWPILSSKALYGLSGNVVETICQDSEVDPAAVLVTFLTAAGAMIGPGTYVNVGATKHQPRLFSAVIGVSAKARKGMSADPIRQIIGLSKVPLKISNGPLSSGEGLVYAVRDASDKTDGKNKQAEEEVADKCLLVIDGELSSAFKVLERSGNNLSSILRTAWDNGNIAPLTKHDRISTTDAHICVVGHITSYELGAVLQTSDIWNGFANRYLWVCARRQKLVPCPGQLDISSMQKLADQLSEISKMMSGLGPILFTQDTKCVWEKIYPELSSDEPGVFGAVTARGEAQTLRIALIYALLDRSREILPKHLEAALALWEYCKDSARFIFADAVIDPIANKIFQALADGSKTQTDLNKLFSGHISSDRLRKILTDLQGSGRITQHKQSNGTGKASTIWSLTSGFRLPCANFAEFAEKQGG